MRINASRIPSNQWKKVKSPTEIIKINLYVENAGAFGVKKTMKKEKQGAKFT